MRQKWQQIKHNTISLDRVLSSNLWWLRGAIHVKFTEKKCDMFSKACFSEKCERMAKRGFSATGLSRKRLPMEWNWSDSLLKKQFRVSKEVHTDSDMKGPTIIDFPKKGATVNHHHHHVAPSARISLTLSRHSSYYSSLPAGPRATSRISTALLYVGSSWSSCFCSSM